MKRVNGCKNKTRHVGIDLGKRTYAMSIVENGKVSFTNGKTFAHARQSLYKKLRAGDKVGIEAGNLAFIMTKEIEAAVGCKVHVLNPGSLKDIYMSMKKTDKEDSLKLARIIENYKEEHLPVVPVPSDEEMRRRQIVSACRRSQQQRVRLLNQLHGLFLAQGITTITKSNLATDENRKETVKLLKGFELEEAEHILEVLEKYEERIRKLDALIEADSKDDADIQRVKTIPGVGPKTAFAFFAHVAKDRFENASQVSNYLGLVPRVYMSGDIVRYGNITKRGNGYMRGLLVQASWALVRSKNGGRLKERFIYMTKTKGLGKKKAIVAIARRLAELMYTLTKNKSKYLCLPFKAEKLAA